MYLLLLPFKTKNVLKNYIGLLKGLFKQNNKINNNNIIIYTILQQ